MTPRQLKLLHLAARQVFGPEDDARYRLLLKNVAGVKSSKDLTNDQFDEVMSVLEACGFQDKIHGSNYWQSRSQKPTRLIHKCRELAAQVHRYPLEALVKRFTDDRTNDPDQLLPREAWNLVEMLKEVLERQDVAK
jgi:hypothetical protein